METLKDFMDKKAVGDVLEQIAAFLELKGENPFRIRAFRTAARAIAGFSGDLRQGLEDGSLAAAKGVGPATLQIAVELINTGRAGMLEELREQIPPGLVEMLSIAGLGVAKIRQIHDVLGIDSLPDLEAAATDGRLAKLPRFGQKTSENILKSIAFLRQASAYRLSHHAADEAEGLRAALAKLPGVTAALIAGDVRRRTEVVRDLVMVLVADVSPGELFKRLSQHPGRPRVRRAGRAPAHAPLRRRRERADHRDDAGQRGRRTGAGHRQRAARGPAGGARVGPGAARSPARRSGVAASSSTRPTRRRLYRALGLDYIEPELREGRGEIAAAERNELPRLVERGDLRGFLHCHTKYSDGSNTIEELALACQAAGYQWIGITDHSQAAAYAGGLKADDLLRQADEIDEVNAGLDGIRVLKGVEADILGDGRVDFEERVLQRLDFVIASIHSPLQHDRRGDDLAPARRDGQPIPHHHRPSDRSSAPLARPVRAGSRSGDREGGRARRGAGGQCGSPSARPGLESACGGCARGAS